MQESTNLYLKVLSRIEHELQVRPDGNNTFAVNCFLHYDWSETEPSLRATLSGNQSVVMCDIELHVNASKLVKWTKHSSQCSLLILVVPRPAMEQTEELCVKTFSNYEIWGYSEDKRKKSSPIILYR